MNLPSLEQRLTARAHRIVAPVMYQRWSDLLFLHWRWDAADLQRRLPAGLYVDTHDGAAWLGVVPFFMERIRPRFLPPVPWVSWFLELNVRTYVHDAQGTPGVWFFSLDCNQPLAVRLARGLFRLPYFDARMKASRSPGGRVHYECRRRGAEKGDLFEYQLAGPAQAAAPGTLEFFLVERYVLFAETSRGLRKGRVQHEPYALSAAKVEHSTVESLTWNGFPAPGRAPDHVTASRGVDVRVGRLELP